MNRTKEVSLYALLHGIEKASKKFNIKRNTVRRIIRRATENKKPKKPAKILELDIETAPMEVYVWDLKQNGGYIDYRNIIKDWNLLCWSGKWLNGHEYIGDVLKPRESIKRNDERIVYSAWKALEKADVVIGHNVKQFDIRSLNARFLYYNFT